ncbi:PI-PLC X domain-containing protein 1-like [Diachasmimorpha longicaudata]|uniref:PI-PLC X domain-containing protein 1-like n=1 Tax=Diachasmimorpha longicaudata TaxID=58733 RepID=UPI0030B8E4F3
MLRFAVVLSLICGVFAIDCEEHDRNETEEIQLGIVISPIMTAQMIREIGIYWKNSKLRNGDTIGLYEDHPGAATLLVFEFRPDVTHGFKKTGISADFIPTANLTFEETCLKYHVNFVRNNTIIKSNCLSTHPTWMAQRKSSLEKLRMREIFLPGTHDSAAYAKHEGSQFSLIVDKYTITQDEDVLAQLIYGARYLDIRVGRYPNHQHEFWGNHGPFRIVPLKFVIDAVKTFLDNTDEIVIFDVQEFPTGFKSMAAHNQLVDYLEKQFADYFMRRPTGLWKTSLGEIWASRKRLIIGYDYNSIVTKRTSVWPQVAQQWGNVQTIDALYRHLNKIERLASEDTLTSNPQSQPRAAMAQLTPTTVDVIFNRLGGLRKMAENVDINVTEWYNEEWQHTANVVAVDFIKATGIVETAIEWNDKRAAGC